jgi:hypothetical protein
MPPTDDEVKVAGRRFMEIQTLMLWRKEVQDMLLAARIASTFIPTYGPAIVAAQQSCLDVAEKSLKEAIAQLAAADNPDTGRDSR